MPRFPAVNANGKAVERYLWPARYVTPNAEIHLALLKWRKEAIAEREFFRRGCNSSTDEIDALYKERAAHWLKIQRAVTLMLPYFGAADKKQKEENTELWPLDLESELDEVSRRICLHYG